MEKKNIFFIHGAWCTKSSFNYIIDSLYSSKKYSKYINDTICFEYDNTRKSIRDIVSDARDMLYCFNRDTIVIGHSMGGLIALALEQEDPTKKVITIASPIAGLKVPRLSEFFLLYREPALNDIMYHSSFMNVIHTRNYTKPICNVIATRGFNPFIFEKSDGVISISSQTKWFPKNSKVVEIYSSHHEILQNEELIDIVKESLTDW
jgi:pimeloyl-ACP methyl ester carboxylesterase